MIPLKLALRNFMCYRDNVPPLSFEGIHVACLCGDNGNGKSALLDAMTWALWGKSRAKSDDDLVHLGQAEMEVELEFAVQQQRYRVVRKHAKPGVERPGQSLLDLQVAGEGGFRSIAGNNLRETQQKLVDILHLDYETFINSAFLLQGRANEFSLKQPGQRKEILTNILGLWIYDEFEARAKALAKEREGEDKQIQSSLADIELELSHEGKYHAEQVEVQTKLVQLEEQMSGAEASLNTLRVEKESLERKREQLIGVEGHIAEVKKELERWGRQVKECKTRIGEYEEAMTRRSDIEEGYAHLVKLKGLNDELNDKLRLLVGLNENKNRLEMAIEKAGSALVVEHEVAQGRIREQEAKSQQLPQLEAELDRVRAQLEELALVEEDLARKRQRLQELLAQFHHLESTNAQLEREIETSEEKLRLLAQGDAKCPLCETELGNEGRFRIEEKYRTEIRARANTQRANQEEMGRKRQEHKALEGEIARAETEVNKERIKRQSRTSIIEKEIAEARKVEEELVKGRLELSGIEERLVRRDYAIAEQQALDALEKQISELGYDPQQHEEVKLQLVELQEYEHLMRKLEEADRLLDQERVTLARAEEAASNLGLELENEENKREGLTEEVAALPGLVSRAKEAEDAYKLLLKEERQWRDRLAAVGERLRRCAELTETKKERERLWQQVLREGGIYKELVEAFGKRGIQALLIERALPEIQDAANRLLMRMTENRMAIRIETQREKKKGGTVETLEIKIDDELGTRNYEMFSGGEAFRIDFALRIALSKLLARRAGASLPTLIIDEGFGTQDGAGRERLIEAINSVQNDFEKVIVITHIEELKDAFPVRIDVVKTSEGSIVTMQ